MGACSRAVHGRPLYVDLRACQGRSAIPIANPLLRGLGGLPGATEGWAREASKRHVLELSPETQKSPEHLALGFFLYC